MKPATIAPFYACLYPGLCDVSRQHGYAMTIHGSVVTDLDLVAIPWAPEVIPAEELVQHLMQHINALGYRDLLRRDCDWATPEQIDQMVLNSNDQEPCTKPHGRLAWHLYLHMGAKVDLSVMPRMSS